MLITELQLKNFKNYEDKVIQFQKVSVFLDKNGTGKSTLLQALNFAISGDFKEEMIRDGQSEMSVSLTFDSGLIVTRVVKNKKISHRMGYGKTKVSTKEKVNEEIAAMTRTNMNNLKVIASSSAVFNMKAEELSNFFMNNIPNTMTVDKVLSYIEDNTPKIEAKVRSLLPENQEFGIESIHRAYDKLYEERRELAKVIRNDKLLIGDFDFQVPVRQSSEIQEDLSAHMKHIGELKAQEKQAKEWKKQKEQRVKTLSKLHSIQDEVKEIVITDVPADENERTKVYEELKKSIETVSGEMSEIKQVNATMKTIASNTSDVVNKLRTGMCPQLKNMKCPYDWTGKIKDFEDNLSKIELSLKKNNEILERKESALKEKKQYLEHFENQMKLIIKKQHLVNQFKSLRETLQELPPEPDSVDMELANQKSQILQDELKVALKREQLLTIYQDLPKKEDTYSVLDKLVSAFSKKGDVIEKNLKFYLDFFEKRINEKAAALGYQISLKSENGLLIQISKTGYAPVLISNASGGEKALAIFLLLDVFNSITGVNLIFFDEVEVLDNEVFKKLLLLIREQMSDYDHIIITGVDHKDTISAVKDVFQ